MIFKNLNPFSIDIPNKLIFLYHNGVLLSRPES